MALIAVAVFVSDKELKKVYLKSLHPLLSQKVSITIIKVGLKDRS